MAFSWKILLSQTELLDDSAVAVDILLLKIVQKVTALTDHFKKTATGVVVVVVGLQVLGQVGNSLGENGDLYLGRTCVTLVHRVGLDDLCFYFFVKHFLSPHSEYFAKTKVRLGEKSRT